jgi:LPS-assembly lipoprotein
MDGEREPPGTGSRRVAPTTRSAAQASAAGVLLHPARARACTPAALLLALATLATAGCGFHLQGASPLPEGSRKVRIITADEVTPFAVELRRAIERSGGTIVSTTAEAETVLRILRDRSGRRVLSVSASNTPQEYEIFYVVEYSVERTGKEVLEAQPLEMLRNMSFDGAQLLAKDREETILREAMARDLALLVVRRLESL